MRKLIYLATIAIVVGIFIGCSNKDEKFTLVGKTYAADSGNKNSNGQTIYYVYRFFSESETERTVRYGSPSGAISGNASIDEYKLNYPKLEIWSALEKEFLPYTFVDKKTFRRTVGNKTYEFILQ